MVDRPIIFSGAMVRALLDGSKTQTRRLITKQTATMDGGPCIDGDKPELEWENAWLDGSFPGSPILKVPCGDCVVRVRPRVEVGDRLWVRENFALLSFGDYLPTKSLTSDYRYMANDPHRDMRAEDRGYPWKPSIHMPRKVSRITLPVTDVRIQRLQDITEVDARAEGIARLKSGRGYYDPTLDKSFVRLGHYFDWAADAFETLWDSINSARAPWSSNPWVIATTFTMEKGNIDR